MNTNVLVHSTGHNTLRYSVHSFYIPDQYFGILLYQCLYFNYIILCMILPRSRLGLAAMKEIPLYWSGLMKEWKCEEKPEVYHGEWSPSALPHIVTLYCILYCALFCTLYCTLYSKLYSVHCAVDTTMQNIVARLSYSCLGWLIPWGTPASLTPLHWTEHCTIQFT